MDSVSDLKYFCTFTHQLYIYCKITQNSDFLLRGVAHELAKTLPQPFHLFHMEGDYLRPKEGAQLRGPLMIGETVLLLCQEDTPLASKFLDAWYDYLNVGSASAFIPVVRHLELEPTPQLKTPGHLIVLHVVSDHGQAPEKVFTHRLCEEDVTQLEEQGKSSSLPITTLGISSRSSEQTITMKEICLLHQNDGTKALYEPFRRIDIHAGPLTWSNLQRLLCESPAALDENLDTLLSQKHINKEQWQTMRAAIDYLTERAQKNHRPFEAPLYESIFDAVWALDRMNLSGFVFRGQSNAEWGLNTSLLRDVPGTKLDFRTLFDRANQTEDFLCVLREKHYQMFHSKLNEQELLAIAQHYGFPTPLLDFTESHRIAAFFASQKAQKLSADNDPLIGVIYYLNPANLRFQTDQFRLEAFSLIDAVKIQVGEFQLIKPNIPDKENRIARQQGVFLAGYQQKDLQGVAIDRIYFRQHPGEVFEDPTMGITKEHLLSETSELYKLSESIKKSFQEKERRSFHSMIGSMAVHEKGIIGSEGVQLYAQLGDDANFLYKLQQQDFFREHPFVLGEISKIFATYFRNALAQAEAGELVSAIREREILDPFNDAVEQLAERCQVDQRRLWDDVKKYQPQALPVWPPDETNFRQDLLSIQQPSQHPERIALACALFLARWEHLRHVDGVTARQLAIKSFEVLLK